MQVTIIIGRDETISRAAFFYKLVIASPTQTEHEERSLVEKQSGESDEQAMERISTEVLDLANRHCVELFGRKPMGNEIEVVAVPVSLRGDRLNQELASFRQWWTSVLGMSPEPATYSQEERESAQRAWLARAMME